MVSPTKPSASAKDKKETSTSSNPVTTTKVKKEKEPSPSYWLEKIYLKMEMMENVQLENNRVISENIVILNERMSTLCQEVSSIKGKLDEVISVSHSIKHKTKTTLCNLPTTMEQMDSIVSTRKLAYYNKMRSQGIADIYKGFLQKDPPFIPKKFREGKIPGESSSQMERMKKLEIMKVNLDIERLEEEASKHQEGLLMAEEEIKALITQYNDPVERQKLKEKWTIDVNREEKVSDEVWEKKKIFFVNLPSTTKDDDDDNDHHSVRNKKYRNNSRNNNFEGQNMYSGEHTSRNDYDNYKTHSRNFYHRRYQQNNP